MNAFNSAPEAVDVYYHLRPDIELQPDKGESGFVISQTPLTMLRVNQTLFKILNLLDSPTTFEKILEKYPLVDEHGLKQTLDTLVEKNYVETHEVVKGYLPSITIIIPVKNRAEDTRACLDSLQALDYPKEKLEIIVVDGGSTDDTRTIIESFPVKGIYLNGTKGPSECRNHGAAEANGELLAFIDSDCLASPAWLKELVPYFYNKDVGIVGGYVASFYDKSQVDRYESVGSSLNMGKRTLRGVNDSSTAYVPTCNVLVRKRAFFEAGGFVEELTVGEDVDFCWRLRKLNWLLLYVPRGTVLHKHRSSLLKMLTRRFDYGTSEGMLHRRHRDKKKNFSLSWQQAAFFILFSIALALLPKFVTFTWIPLVVGFGIMATDVFIKSARLRKLKINIKTLNLTRKSLRSYLSTCYYLSFHFIRYYLILIIGLGILFHGLWVWTAAMLLVTTTVDYVTRKPKLNYVSFMVIYTLEHIFYQCGVFAGCVRQKYFGSYVPVFIRV